MAYEKDLGRPGLTSDTGFQTNRSLGIGGRGCVDKRNGDKYDDELLYEGTAVDRMEGRQRADMKRRLPPDYDGKGNFQLFKYQFELLAKRYGWNESDKVFNLTESLKGEA